MSETPAKLKYTETHQWALPGDDGIITVGITDYAQDTLGDVVFVELPETGREVRQGEQVAIVESVKAASDVYTPVSGTVIAVNATLEDSPEAVNESPYENGWFFKIRASDPSELDKLLDGAAYDATCE
jgi:glycine cleavage system H protein